MCPHYNFAHCALNDLHFCHESVTLLLTPDGFKSHLCHKPLFLCHGFFEWVCPFLAISFTVFDKASFVEMAFVLIHCN